MINESPALNFARFMVAIVSLGLSAEAADADTSPTSRGGHRPAKSKSTLNFGSSPDLVSGGLGMNSGSMSGVFCSSSTFPDKSRRKPSSIRRR